MINQDGLVGVQVSVRNSVHHNLLILDQNVGVTTGREAVADLSVCAFNLLRRRNAGSIAVGHSHLVRPDLGLDLAQQQVV